MNPLKTLRKFFAGTYGTITGFWNQWQTPEAERKFLRQYSGYVYACVSAIAEDVAMIDFKVYRELADGSLGEVAGHPLLRVLDNPNPLMSKYQLIEMTQTHIELAGEAFWYSELGEVTGKPKSFYLLPPDRMNVAIDTDSELPRIAGYIFNKEDGTRIPLQPEEITHFKMPNPWDPFRGYGTVEAAIIYIMTEKFGSEFTRNYIFNNAMPAGIINIKGTIDETEFEKVKKQWKQEYGNVDKAGKTAFIRNSEVEFIKVGTTLGEAALKEIKDMSRDDIMTMFRVSKPILGIFEDVNLASAKTAQYVFMSRVIDPKMSRMVDTLQFVLNRWNLPTTKYIMGYESPVPEDIEEKIKLYEAARNNWMTTNEIRKEEGLEDVDGGHMMYQPLNLVPMGAKMMPPNGGEQSFKKQGKVIIKRTTRRTVSKPKSLEYQAKENFRLELVGNSEAWAKKYQEEFKTLLIDQEKQILDNISEETAKGAVKKAFDEYMFDSNKENKRFAQHLTPIEYELIKEQGALAMSMLNEEELSFQLNEAVRKEVDQRIARMVRDFNDETKQALTKTLTESFATNEPRDKLVKRIKDVYADGQGYRAERVARTETINASNAAAKEAYLQTGYITKIEWFANPGACEYCQTLNNKVIGIQENFYNLGDNIESATGGKPYPVGYSDIGYPPAHPNCTCTILPVRE